MKFALVISRFNTEITSGLERGARQFLAEKDIAPASVDRFDAPGAFETPLIAKRLARSGRYDGVICLGCVIKGETAHFEYISLAAAYGIVQASLETDVPVAFGILTTYTEEQAIARSRDDAENKGREAAAACWETARTLASIGA